MIDINLNAVPDWERSRRNTEPEVSNVSRAEALDGGDRAKTDNGSNGVEIDEEDANQQNDPRQRRQRARRENEAENSSDQASAAVDGSDFEQDSVRYDEEGDPVNQATRGRIVDTDA